MIQKKDAIIGRWFNYYQDSCIGYVLGVQVNSFSNSSKIAISIEGGGYTVTDLEDLTPIKITEEIMLKCDAYWDDVLDEKDALVLDVTENIRIGWCGYLFLLIEGYVLQINNANSEYVHQLQNIYADLSGKELNINL